MDGVSPRLPNPYKLGRILGKNDVKKRERGDVLGLLKIEDVDMCSRRQEWQTSPELDSVGHSQPG